MTTQTLTQISNEQRAALVAEGRHAYDAGKAISSTPYERWGERHGWWLHGYLEACLAAGERAKERAA